MYTIPETEIRIDTRLDGIESAVIYSYFDEALKVLTKRDYEIISLPKNAQLRIQQGKGSYISENGNWTREGVLYFPYRKPRLVRNSPILLWIAKAMEAKRRGEEFFPTEWQTEQTLKDSIEFPKRNTEIPTNRFDSDELTVYAFGGENEAGNYGEFLRNEGIEKMYIRGLHADYINSQKWPFVRQIWFSNLDSGSGFCCDSDLDYGMMLRGIKKSNQK